MDSGMDSSISSIDLSIRSTTHLCDEPNSPPLHLNPTELDSSHQAFAGVKEEYARRYPHIFTSDYSDFLKSPSKTLSASTFMFFATIFSTIALGAHLSEVGDYGEYMGVSEYLLMNSLSGLYFSVLSCQPLMILRPTGPITLIIENIIIISEKYNINFWHLLACSGYFVGLWMTLIAAFEGSKKIGLLTRFTHETFTFYVCSIYIYNGVNDVVSNFQLEDEDGSDAFGKSAFMAVLAVLAFAISLVLSSCGNQRFMSRQSNNDIDADNRDENLKKSVLESIILNTHAGRPGDRSNLWSILSAPESSSGEASSSINSDSDGGADCIAVKWNIFTPYIRSLLTDYSVTVAVVVVTLLSFAPSRSANGSVDVDRVSVPSGVSPTFAERSWLVSFTAEAYQSFYNSEVETGNYHETILTIIMAFAISIPIVFFFYIDQNLSCVLSQAPHIDGMKGGKGTYVHSPFLCVAICNAIGPSFGLPFITASLPHSPQFVMALTENDVSNNNKGSDTSSTSENRVAPLLVYFLIGLVSFTPSIVRNIPLGAVRGVLAYVGFAGILTTELWQRLVMLCRPLPLSLEIPSLRPSLDSSMVTMKFMRVHAFTLLQVVFLIFFWVLNISPEPVGLLVAFAVAALGPLRIYVLPRYFSEEELALLDS